MGTSTVLLLFGDPGRPNEMQRDTRFPLGLLVGKHAVALG